jgi:hypothetical protein
MGSTNGGHFGHTKIINLFSLSPEKKCLFEKKLEIFSDFPYISTSVEKKERKMN